MLLKNETKKDNIVRGMISDIASGAYSRKGFIPSERYLCRQYHVNRGTLRKALLVLKDQKIIETRSRSRSYIQKFNIRKIPEIYLPAGFRKVDLAEIIEARKVIEVPAVQIACMKITKRELRTLESFFTAMKQNNKDLFGFIGSDMNFHYTIIKAAHNPVLLKAYEAIDLYHKYSQVLTSSKHYAFKGTVKTHGKLLEAVKKRDVKLCKAIMTRHFVRMEKFNRRMFKAKGK